MYARSLFGGAPSKSKKSSSASSKSAPEHRLGAFHDEAPDAKGMNKAIHQVLKQANAFNASQTVGAGLYNATLRNSYNLEQTRNPETEPFKGDEIALISEDIMAWALRLARVNTAKKDAQATEEPPPEYKYVLPNIAFFIADGDWQSVIESDDMARKIAAQLHLPGQEEPQYAMPYRGKDKAQPWEMSCCMEPFTTDQKNKLSQIRGLCVMQAYYELMRGIAGVPSYALCQSYKDRQPNAIRVRGQFQTHGDPDAYQNWLNALMRMSEANDGDGIDSDYGKMARALPLAGGALTQGNNAEWGSRLECATWGHLPFIKHFKGDGKRKFADLAPEGTFKEATTVLPKGDYILDDSKKDTRGMHVAASKSGGPYGRYGKDDDPNARFTHRGTGEYGRTIAEGQGTNLPVLLIEEDDALLLEINAPKFRLAMVRKGRSDDRETAQSSSAAFSGDGRETFSSLDEPQLVGMKEAWERSAGARYKAVYRTDLLPPRGASRCIVMTKEQGRKKNLRIPECVIPASYGALGGEVGTMLVLGSPMLRPAQLRSRKSGTIALGALLEEQKKIAEKAGRGGDQESMKILEMAALTMKQVNNRGAVDGVITSMEALRDAKELAKEQNMKWNPRPARGAGHDHIARGDFKKLTMNKEGRDEAIELMLNVFGNEKALLKALRSGQPLWGQMSEGADSYDKWNDRLSDHAKREARRYGLTEADARVIVKRRGDGEEVDLGFIAQMKRRPSSSLVVLGLVPCSWSFCEYFVRDAPATIPVTLGNGNSSIIPLPMTNPIALWAHVDLFADRFGGKRKAKEFADFVQKQLAEATKSGNYERVQEVGRFIKSWVECQIKEQADGVPCEMDDAVLSTAGIEIRRPTDEKFEFKNDRYVKKHLQDIHKKLAEFSSSTAESESELLRQQADEALATFRKLSESLQAKADGGRRSRRRVRDGEFSDDVKARLEASRRKEEDEDEDPTM